MITVTVNGERRQLEAATNVLEYVGSLGLSLRRVAVAHNGTVLRREELATVLLSDGDRLEIVHAVGGG